MMTVNSVTSSAAPPSGAGSSKAMAQLGQVDFLKLMTAQLRQQDPTNPADSSQMVVQMAQMSSAGGIAQMTTTLGKMAESLTSQTQLLQQISSAMAAANALKGA